MQPINLIVKQALPPQSTLPASQNTDLAISPIHTNIKLSEENLRAAADLERLVDIRNANDPISFDLDMLLQKLTNSDPTGKLFAIPEPVFFFTNETCLTETMDTIKSWVQKQNNHPIVHIGVGSLINYQMALQSGASHILIADVDKRLVDRHHIFLNRVKECKSLSESLKLKRSIEKEYKQLWEIDTESANMSFDWLTHDAITTLQSMFNNKQLCVVQADVRDVLNAFNTLKQDKSLQVKPHPILYTSNVSDWIGGRNSLATSSQEISKNYSEFKLMIHKAVRPAGLHIFTSTVSRNEFGHNIQQTAENSCGIPDLTRIFAGKDEYERDGEVLTQIN